MRDRKWRCDAGTVLTVVSVLLLRAGELNCNCVPIVTFPVLVTESAVLASYAVREKQRCRGCIRNLTWLVTVTHARVMPVLQGPLKNAPAIARTSLGRKGMSKACGSGLAPDIKFRTDWWRASLVMIEAAAARTVGSCMSCVAPRYAETPVYSTTRAIGNMTETLVSALEKSKLQESGCRPNAVRAA